MADKIKIISIILNLFLLGESRRERTSVDLIYSNNGVYYRDKRMDSGNNLGDESIIAEKEKFKAEIQGQMAQVVNSTYNWAKENHPLALEVLQEARKLTKDKLDKIPNAHIFLDVLKHSVENITLSQEKIFQRYSNYSLFQVIEEAEKNRHLNPNDTILVASNLTKEFLQNVPNAKKMVESFMTTKVNGSKLPLGVTLMSLIKHLGNDVHLSNLKDPVFLAEIAANVTKDLGPFVEFYLNNTWPKLKEQFSSMVHNFTESDKVKQVTTLAEVAKNVSNATSDYFKTSMIHYIERKYKN